jgi:excisionase family DNA binding protein
MDRLCLLRVNEVAEVLGIGKSLAYELVATGGLPTVRFGKGKAIRVPLDQLKLWMAKHPSLKAGCGAAGLQDQ